MTSPSEPFDTSRLAEILGREVREEVARIESVLLSEARAIREDVGRQIDRVRDDVTLRTGFASQRVGELRGVRLRVPGPGERFDRQKVEALLIEEELEEVVVEEGMIVVVDIEDFESFAHFCFLLGLEFRAGELE